MSSPQLYYSEFLRYAGMASYQQVKCNLGFRPYAGSVPDDLMCQVELYDVVERKYAGFSQLINDCFYGWTPDHPYWEKMQAGVYDNPPYMSYMQPRQNAKNWTGKRDKWKLEDWLYLFLVHRLTGSGINYAMKPSGYYNTIVGAFFDCDGIEDMVEKIKDWSGTKWGMYTSIGYQFPAFPKPGPGYRRGGDYFMCEMLPELACRVAHFLQPTTVGIGWPKLTLRQLGQFMFDWNASKGLRAYRFQYSAFIADVCDWFPDLVDRESPFYYGSNAVECISYLTGGKKSEADLDRMMLKIYEDTGHLPYNAEDICCDWIRWVENYVRPGDAYDHLDRDKVWSTHRIADHPYGRQRPMLELGLISSFNDLKNHPSDDYVLREAGWTVERYRQAVVNMRESK